MEKAKVIALLEKYWQAETTIAEEQTLAAYFQGEDVDPELRVYSNMFSYFHEETEVTAGPGFGNRILQRLGLPLEEDDAPGGDMAPEPPVVPITRQSFRWGVVGAAAAILLVIASLFLLRPEGQPGILADTRPATNTQGRRVGETADIADTYADPEQALAAVRHALLVASRNLNQGRREITGSAK